MQGSRRRAATFAQVALYTVIVLAILGTVNFLADRYNKSYDSTSDKRFTLSQETDKIVGNLKQNVKISYWDQPSKFQQAQDLLNRYHDLNRKVDVELYDADKLRTQATAAGVKNYGTIFVQVGNKKEEAKGLTEEDITGAIVRALKGGDRTVCFVIGSGEHAPDDTSRNGFSNAKALVEKNNYKTETIAMLPKPEIPKSCTIVVVPGPQHDYLPPEVTALKNYVENGGRALFMLDPPLQFGQPVDANAPLTDLLKGWGVTAQKDLVLDTSGVGQIFGLGPEYALVTKYEDHPIVTDLKNVATGFPIARSLEVMNGDKTTVQKLFATSADSFATQNLSSPEIKQGKDDLKGPLVLAAAGTYHTANKTNGDGRFVVVGSSTWASNGFLAFNGNRDLFLNMLNWLSSDEDLISIRPKEPQDRPLNMNARQVTLMFYSSVISIPLLIVAAGLGVWWKRR
jgi:gliding motility-associatede transport system auxiliary component